VGCLDGRHGTPAGSSAHRPGKRLRRLLLRWQAPQPCPARRSTCLTRPDCRAVAATPTRTPFPTPAPTAIRTHAARVPPPGRRTASPLASPPWGRGASAFDPSVTRPAARSRLRRRSMHSAVRLPHGALAISKPPPYGRRSIPTVPRSGMNGTSLAVTDGSSHSACSVCNDPVRYSHRLLCCDEAAMWCQVGWGCAASTDRASVWRGRAEVG
jgi:hypothetical protein